MFTRSLVWIMTVLALNACSTAQYRSWEDGSEYFEQMSQQKEAGEASSEQEAIDCETLYEVKAGDTLSQISEACGLDLTQLALANDLSPPYTLMIGQTLQLAAPTESPEFLQKVAASQMAWPTISSLNYEFIADFQNRHALQVLGEIGQPIYAVEAGLVVYAGLGIKQFGYMAIVKHESGFLSVYAHNNRLLVKEGQQVNKQQMIATMGRTGNVTDPQLYLEMRYQGHKTDAKALFADSAPIQTAVEETQ